MTDWQFLRGSLGGLGSGLIGWGFDTNRLFLIGIGMVAFFGSNLLPNGHNAHAILNASSPEVSDDR